MKSPKWWMGIALFALLVMPPVARAQDESIPGPPAESWLAADDDPGMDDDMGLAGPGSEGSPGMRGPGRSGWSMGRGRGPGMEGFAMRRRLEDLDLSETQRKKLADIRDQHAKSAINGRANMQLAQLDLRKLLRADKPDIGAVERQIDKVSALRATLEKNRVTGMLEARALLTPEQLEKLRSPRGRRPAPDESR